MGYVVDVLWAITPYIYCSTYMICVDRSSSVMDNVGRPPVVDRRNLGLRARRGVHLGGECHDLANVTRRGRVVRRLGKNLATAGIEANVLVRLAALEEGDRTTVQNVSVGGLGDVRDLAPDLSVGRRHAEGVRPVVRAARGKSLFLAGPLQEGVHLVIIIGPLPIGRHVRGGVREVLRVIRSGRVRSFCKVP